jgi:outer membrane protein TolC
MKFLSLINVFVLFICLHFSILAAASLDQITIQDVMEESARDSLQVQKAESGFKEFQWRKRETFSGFLPTLTGGVNYLTDKKYMLVDVDFGGSQVTIPQILPTSQYTLQATWPIFDGFASTNRYLSGSSMEDSAKSEWEWTVFSTHRQAILQFYRVLASRILEDVAEQNLKTLSDHLKDIQAYRKAGVSTQYDVLRVEVQVSEAQSEILNSQDNLELSQLRLGEILGKEGEKRKPVGKLPVLSENLLKSLQKNTLDSRKDLLALKQKMQGAQYLESSANRYWIPKILLVGSYQKYNNRNDRFDDDSGFRESYQVGVNLSWNIFDGMVSTSRSGIAEQQAVQIEKSYRMAQIKAQNDFEFWRRKFLYYCAVYTSRVNDVARSTEAIRLAREGRRAGTRTNSELLDAETDLYRAHASQVKAQIGAVEALINLELSTGQKLYEFN